MFNSHRVRASRSIAAALVALTAAGTLGAVTSASPADAAAQPPERRVDLDPPTFSDPTNITNPLFPISEVEHFVQLGVDEGELLRAEVTLTDDIKTVTWNGQTIDAVVVHFIAYHDGRIAETAVDFFAQADDGSVWYMGENVNNYEDGEIVNNDGTWLAGRDGPAGMIMPADPQVGDVFRPENIPGLVFEETTVLATDLTVNGPSGPVSGVIRVEENAPGHDPEFKLFAPGYGEFQASIPGVEFSKIAVATPIDSRTGPTPPALDRLLDTAESMFANLPNRNWETLDAQTDRIENAWKALRTIGVPPLVRRSVAPAIEALDDAVDQHRVRAAREAAVQLQLAALDISVQWDDLEGVDDDRIEAWQQQRTLDAIAGDDAGVLSDRAIIRAIRSRIAH